MHNNNIQLIHGSRQSCHLFAGNAWQCRLKAALCPSLSLSLFLLQQCKSERASSAASERGKLDKHSQIPCIGCDCVCVCACLCLRTGCVFVTAIVHTWKTISNCDFEYCRLTNLCLNNCLFRIKVTHTKQLTKIKNRCAGTHTHTHAHTWTLMTRQGKQKRAREAYAGVRSLGTSIKRKQQQTAQHTHTYTPALLAWTVAKEWQSWDRIAFVDAKHTYIYTYVCVCVFDLQLSLMYRVMCFKDIELRADSTDCTIFN